MAYRPYPLTTASTARRLCGYDKDRTNLVMVNISGETCYLGADSSVTTAGTTQGLPIFSNGGFEASFQDGLDPRLERWVIGSAGGTVVVMEEAAVEPGMAENNSLLSRLIEGLEKIIPIWWKK